MNTVKYDLTPSFHLKGSAVTGPVNIIFVYDGAKVVLRVGSSEASESLTGAYSFVGT